MRKVEMISGTGYNLSGAMDELAQEANTLLEKYEFASSVEPVGAPFNVSEGGTYIFVQQFIIEE